MSKSRSDGLISLKTVQILRQNCNIDKALHEICVEVIELPNIIGASFLRLDALCKLSELDSRKTNSHLQGKIIAEAIASSISDISNTNQPSQPLIPQDFADSLEDILLDLGDLEDFARLPQIFTDKPYLPVPILLKTPETSLWGFMILRQRSPLGWDQQTSDTLQLVAMQVAFTLEQEQVKANLSDRRIEVENAYTTLFQWMEQYRSLVEQIPNVTYILPIANTIVHISEFAQRFAFISPQVYNLLGIKPSFWQDDFLNGWVDYVHPEDRQYFQQQIQQTIATGEECNCEYRMLTADGNVVWVRDNVRVGLAIDNQTPVLLGSLFNISDRKMIELALRESEARLEEAQRISKIGHWGWHILSDKISWSSELFRIFDVDPALGTPNYCEHLQFLTVESQRRLDEAVRLAMSQGKSYRMELELARSDSANSPRYIEAIGHADYDQNGEIFRLYGTVQDISDRKNMEAKLAEARIAEEANQAKSKFLAVISHEIRTPMNAVIGMTDILQKTPLSAQQQDYVATIKNGGEILLSVINNVLDLSKIESGAMQIDASPFSISQCIEEVLDLMAAKLFGKPLELFALINCPLPLQIIGDYGRLRQVLVNLVSNAIKFTECGEIVISVNARSLPASSNDQDLASSYELLFEVSDTGMGISDEAIARLFQNFSQADISISRQYGGTGLGLAICKQLCELMGGEITVRSEVGIGSTFSFSIRVQAIDDNIPAINRNAIAAPINIRRILLVHPSPTCQIAIGQYLQPLNIELQFAQNPCQALQLLQNPQSFDAAIIDLDASGFDGSALAQDIQGVLPELKLIALSSTTTVIKTNVFAAQLTKPISANKLYRALSDSSAKPILSIDSLLSNTSLSNAELNTEFSKNHPLQILIAEDNPVNKKVLLLMLESLGYEAKAVTNGAEAIKAINENVYDVVFMDIQMPIMDGLTATKQIRQHSDRQPWIIGLSANAFEEAYKDAQLAGMNEYITKPLQADNLTQVLQKVTQASNFTISQPNQASLDINTLNTLISSIGFENLANLIQDYLAESAHAIAKMQTAFACVDIQTIDFENHALKGGSASFGAIKIFENCSKIKSLCKIALSSTPESSHALSEIEQTLNVIATEYDALVEALQVYMAR